MLKGQKMSKESIEKIRLACLGRIPWNKGKGFNPIPKICFNCGKKFIKPAKVDIKSWEKRKWCRRNCFIEYIKNNPSPLIGFKHSEKFRKDCSRRMKGRYLGENHPNWKGGRHITRKGYVSIYNKCKRIFEHRLVMQTYLKRKLKPS